MKVTSIGPSGSAGPARRTDKASAGKGGFARALSDAMGEVSESQGIDMSSPVTSVDALLATQGTGDATDREQRQRMARRGEEILDRLEDLRHGLLIGAVPKEKLIQLAQMVRSRRETVTDPQLAAMLDEIELRAEVELAKLSR